MPPFVGRQPELAVLRARLAAALAGQPQVVRIEGPAGIGKTALIEHFLREPGVTPGPVVVRASGEDTESLLAYGVVEQLARSAGGPGPGCWARCPGSRTTPVHDPVTVGSRILELLDGLDAGAGVVLVVDDVHWADLPSVQALVFALRRLVADPVLTLLAVRDDADVELPETLRRLVSGHLGSVLRLRGLDEQDLRDLAAELGVDGFEMPAAQRLRFGTQGNPLHAKALLEEFPPSEWGPEEHPLPPPRSFRLLVADRYAGRAAGHPPADRRGRGARPALPAAAGGHPGRGRAAVAGGRRGGPARAAAACRRRSTRGRCRSRTRWSGPRSTTGSARPGGTRCTWPRPGCSTDAAAALRHRVAAAAEPDEQLAADLTAFADAEARRQAWQSAAAHLVDASRLSPDPDEARRRVLQAVVWTVLRGDAGTAAGFRAEIESFPRGPLRDAVLGVAGHRGRRSGDRASGCSPTPGGTAARTRSRRWWRPSRC